jgi:hypothetical protein
VAPNVGYLAGRSETWVPVLGLLESFKPKPLCLQTPLNGCWLRLGQAFSATDGQADKVISLCVSNLTRPIS